MEKAGTNAGMVQERTRLAIQPGIQARLLTKAYTNPRLLKLPAMQTELKNKARIAEVSPSARPANPRLTHR